MQGYDLNYAGVIIGPDLRLSSSGEIVADRDAYRDKKGKEDTGHLKGAFTDADLLVFIRNIYGVLLTRGMLGTCTCATRGCGSGCARCSIRDGSATS